MTFAACSISDGVSGARNGIAPIKKMLSASANVAVGIGGAYEES